MSSVAPAVRRPRIAVIIDQLGSGGAQVMVVRAAEWFPSLSVEPVVADLGDPAPTAARSAIRAAGVEVASFPVRRWNLLELGRAWRLRRWLQEGDFDAVHLHLAVANTIGSLLARSLRLPAVAVLHGSSVPQGWKATLKRRIEQWALRWTRTTVVAVSSSVATAYETGLGHRPILIDNPVSMDQKRRDDPDVIAARRELLQGSHGPLVLAVGRLVPVKATDVLFDAFRLVVARHPDARLVVVGDGPLDVDLESRRRALSYGASIALVGRRDDVPVLMAAADCFAMSSRSEGQPLAVLEAMVAGTPCVLTAVGGVPDMVGETAVLVPSDNAEALGNSIVELLADPARSAHLAEQASARVRERHDPRRWAERLIALAGSPSGPAS